jgi:hypothetical protein
MDDIYDDLKLDDRLTDAAAKVSLDLCGQEFSSVYEAEKSVGYRNYIQSVVGDDESNTSNSVLFSVLIIIAGTIISGIKLSYKDCGTSHYIANFAEGWVLSPPASEASFEATNRRHQGNGVPWVLDVPKLKYISAVRKQSCLELDLESKYIHLSKVAAWTNRSWFTYNFHQMALLLANCVFDFVGGRTFPFLFPEEGGCGGLPPYSNLETSFAHLVRFNRGRSLRAILGVMDESTRIHHRQMSPNEGLFVRASHLAQMGDKRWLSYVAAYTSLLKVGEMSRGEVRDLLRSDTKSSLPEEVLDYGIEVQATDPTMGSAISHLRKDGFILTELDVKMVLESRRKQAAIGGDVPLRNIIEQVDEEVRQFKANHWKVLSELSYASELKEFTTILPANWQEDAKDRDSPLWNILGEYYLLRSSTYDKFTSFAYSDTIRVFKRSDIEMYIRRTPSLLKRDISLTIDLPGIIRRFETDIPSEKSRKQTILDWIDSSDLESLLKNPLPIGVGPDDGRIFRSLTERINEYSLRDHNRVIVIIISSDRELTRRTWTYLTAQFKRFCFLLMNIDAVAYIRICLEMIKEESERDPLFQNSRTHRPGLSLYNYILGKEMAAPAKLQEQVARFIQIKATVLVEFDYPNVERFLERTRYDPTTNTVVETSGGFLDKRTLHSLPTNECWSARPMAKLMDLADFNKSTRKRYPVGRLHAEKLLFYRPIHDQAGRVQNWRIDVANSGE